MDMYIYAQYVGGLKSLINLFIYLYIYTTENFLFFFN